MRGIKIIAHRRSAADERLDDLIAGADATGFTLDYLALLTDGLSLRALRRVIENAASLPAHCKVSNNPHVWRGWRECADAHTDGEEA